VSRGLGRVQRLVLEAVPRSLYCCSACGRIARREHGVEAHIPMVSTESVRQNIYYALPKEERRRSGYGRGFLLPGYLDSGISRALRTLEARGILERFDCEPGRRAVLHLSAKSALVTYRDEDVRDCGSRTCRFWPRDLSREAALAAVEEARP